MSTESTNVSRTKVPKIIFASEVCSLFNKQHPDATFRERSKMMSAMWNALTPEEREKYEPTREKNPTKDKQENVRMYASPYILFCYEIRPSIAQRHPEATFGDKAKILGAMWRALSLEDKDKYVHRVKCRGDIWRQG